MASQAFFVLSAVFIFLFILSLAGLRKILLHVFRNYGVKVRLGFLCFRKIEWQLKDGLKFEIGYVGVSSWIFNANVKSLITINVDDVILCGDTDWIGSRKAPASEGDSRVLSFLPVKYVPYLKFIGLHVSNANIIRLGKSDKEFLLQLSFPELNLYCQSQLGCKSFYIHANVLLLSLQLSELFSLDQNQVEGNICHFTSSLKLSLEATYAENVVEVQSVSVNVSDPELKLFEGFSILKFKNYALNGIQAGEPHEDESAEILVEAVPQNSNFKDWFSKLSEVLDVTIDYFTLKKEESYRTFRLGIKLVFLKVEVKSLMANLLAQDVQFDQQITFSLEANEIEYIGTSSWLFNSNLGSLNTINVDDFRLLGDTKRNSGDISFLYLRDIINYISLNVSGVRVLQLVESDPEFQLHLSLQEFKLYCQLMEESFYVHANVLLLSLELSELLSLDQNPVKCCHFVSSLKLFLGKTYAEKVQSVSVNVSDPELKLFEGFSIVKLKNYLLTGMQTEEPHIDESAEILVEAVPQNHDTEDSLSIILPNVLDVTIDNFTLRKEESYRTFRFGIKLVALNVEINCILPVAIFGFQGNHLLLLLAQCDPVINFSLRAYEIEYIGTSSWLFNSNLGSLNTICVDDLCLLGDAKPSSRVISFLPMKEISILNCMSLNVSGVSVLQLVESDPEFQLHLSLQEFKFCCQRLVESYHADTSVALTVKLVEHLHLDQESDYEVEACICDFTSILRLTLDVTCVENIKVQLVSINVSDPELRLYEGFSIVKFKNYAFNGMQSREPHGDELTEILEEAVSQNRDFKDWFGKLSEVLEDIIINNFTVSLEVEEGYRTFSFLIELVTLKIKKNPYSTEFRIQVQEVRASTNHVELGHLEVCSLEATVLQEALTINFRLDTLQVIFETEVMEYFSSSLLPSLQGQESSTPSHLQRRASLQDLLGAYVIEAFAAVTDVCILLDTPDYGAFNFGFVKGLCEVNYFVDWNEFWRLPSNFHRYELHFYSTYLKLGTSIGALSSYYGTTIPLSIDMIHCNQTNGELQWTYEGVNVQWTIVSQIFAYCLIRPSGPLLLMSRFFKYLLRNA